MSNRWFSLDANRSLSGVPHVGIVTKRPDRTAILDDWNDQLSKQGEHEILCSFTIIPYRSAKLIHFRRDQFN